MDFIYFQNKLLNQTIQGAKGNYKILGLIAAGTGGMVMKGLMDNMKNVAVKYQSFISDHETNVCLKFLANNFTNIVNILDIFKNQDHAGCFIIMDFADMPLTKYINGKNEFADTKSQQFYNMIKQICCGILELHKMKIIHRDFKPDNIVVKLENNIVKYMLCDLGLVRSDENDFKKTKQIGTPMFMAPELLNEEQYSVKVDIWALGCMLYSLLARKHLFEGNTVQETLTQVSKITQQEIDSKINQIQNLDQEFKQLLIKMIQIQQSNRLTINQVIEQINNYYNNQQQTPIQRGQIQLNAQFIPQQIILKQKPKFLPQQQLKIENDRILKANEIQCNQMKDNLKLKLNEQEKQLVIQYCKNGQQYTCQQVQQIIQQTIQVVQNKSFDVIDQLYVIKLESDRKIILEQLGQKELKQSGHLTELNQKQMEINKNLDLINNLDQQLQTFKQQKEDNDKNVKNLSSQLQQYQNQINALNELMQTQSEEINVIKAKLGSSLKELQNQDQIHQQEINKHLSFKCELQSEINMLKQNLANLEQVENKKQIEIAQLLEVNQKYYIQYDQQQQRVSQLESTIEQLNQNLAKMQQELIQYQQLGIKEIENNRQLEINRLLEDNQKYYNQYEQQKQFIQQKVPEFESTIEQLTVKLKQAEEKLQQVNHIPQQQNEKQTSVNEGLNKNYVMLGYLKELTDYIKQQDTSQNIESDQMKNNILPIQNYDEQKQNEIQSDKQTKSDFTQQIISPNQQVNMVPQNNSQQHNGFQFQQPQNTNKPYNQLQPFQFQPTQFQNLGAYQFQPPANFNSYQQPPNFANQNAQNPLSQSLQQQNSSGQQRQSQSQIFKPNFVNFNPSIQKPDQK